MSRPSYVRLLTQLVCASCDVAQPGVAKAAPSPWGRKLRSRTNDDDGANQRSRIASRYQEAAHGEQQEIVSDVNSGLGDRNATRFTMIGLLGAS